MPCQLHGHYSSKAGAAKIGSRAKATHGGVVDVGVALLLGLHLLEAEELLALQLIQLALRGGTASSSAPPT
jgi:hypothetical protein